MMYIQEAALSKEWTGRSFKSGNSVAIRIPAELAIEAGQDWTIRRNDDGDLVVSAKARKTERIDLTGIYGSKPGLKPLTSADREFEERELDWTGERLKRG